MSRPLKFSKVSEMEDQEDTDMISRLPDELLGYMLSFLLTKSAVGTSILSSRWRYLHMLTNCLSFKAPFEVRQKKAFKKFVNRVLLLHKASSIEKFSLDCGQHVFDDLDLHTWVTVAISKGVEQLHLSFNGQLKALPHCLFSSPKLVELKLTCIRGIQVPKSIDLPNLKILHLRAIKFRCTGSFQKLFSACSLLQELEVVHCEWPTYLYTSNHLCISSRKLKRLTINSLWADFEVDAPNLAYLHYTKDDEHIALSLRNSSCLITAILDLHFTDSDLIQPVALALIKAVGHAKELQLLGETSEYLTCFMDDHIPSYPNMVNLRLGYCTDATWKYVVHWLANSPRLETLIFEQRLLSFNMETDEWPTDVELVPFSSRVKVIEAYDFRGHKIELVLVKYLLANAEVLQRLSLYKDHHKMSKDEELQASNELLMLPRASRTCVVHLTK